MIKIIGFKFAINTLILLLIFTLLYHLAIVTELIPYSTVWGGHLEEKSQMYKYELFSAVVNLVILSIIAIKGSYINVKISPLTITIFLWIFTVMFTFNSIGNLLSNSSFETMIFTPLSILSAVLCFRLAVEK